VCWGPWPDDDVGHTPRGVASRRVSWVLVGSAVLLLLSMLLRGLPEPTPVGDIAIAELYVLHVTRTIGPFGPYSQYSWHHPGPAMFQLLAPLYVA
jgi:hypothetical protein